MNRTDKTWEEMVSLAEHYLAIGMDTMFLHGNSDKPWAHVVEFECKSRANSLGMATFTAEHSGLKFIWQFNLDEFDHGNGWCYREPRGDHIELRSILNRLPKAFADKLRGLIAERAAECDRQAIMLKTNANELRSIAG